MAPPSDWGSLQQAADYCGVSAKTIRRWIASGHIAAKRFGPRVIRIRMSSLDAAGRDLRRGA